MFELGNVNSAGISATSGTVNVLKYTSTNTASGLGIIITSGNANVNYHSFDVTIDQSGATGRINLSSYTPSITAVSGELNAIYSTLASGTGRYFINHTGTAQSLFAGHIKITTAGQGLFVKEGSNAMMGSATLSGGSVVINTTSVTANSRIFLTCQESGSLNGTLRVSSRTAGTSFTISTGNALDNALICWLIIEPA